MYFKKHFGIIHYKLFYLFYLQIISTKGKLGNVFNWKQLLLFSWTVILCATRSTNKRDWLDVKLWSRTAISLALPSKTAASTSSELIVAVCPPLQSPDCITYLTATRRGDLCIQFRGYSREDNRRRATGAIYRRP